MEKKKIIIIASIAVAVLVAIGAAVFGISSFFKGSNKDDSSSDAIVSGEYAEQDGDAVITIGSVEGKKGDTIVVPVKISNNPGFVASLFSFSYDKDSLEYIGYDKGDFLKDYEFADDKGVLKFLGMEDKDTKTNGLLFNLKFKITAEKDSEIKLATEEMINFDEQTIKLVSKSGKVKVK